MLLFASSACAELFRLQLRWTPQSQFMGYYVAQTLDSNEADAAVEWLGAALAQKELGQQYVNVAQVFQRSSLMLLCHRNLDIHQPSDLKY